METLTTIKHNLEPGGRWHAHLSTLYGPSKDGHGAQIQRYQSLVDTFSARFAGQTQAVLFTTPGRTEVIGNHTDHNAGYVVAAAVDLDILAVAAPCAGHTISIHSAEHGDICIDISNLDMVPAEKGTSAGMVRGVCARMSALGYRLGGFCACTHSTVMQGSGLSSSAAFQVLMVSILSHFYNEGRVPAVQAAQMAQYAENVYFGKPCGLMDQTTCAVGGFVFIDFEDFEHPRVEQIDFDFANSGYSLMIVDTGGNHADLTEDYTLLENEMKAAARALGAPVLRPTSAQQLADALPELRGQGLSDRAILRAFHYYDENERVLALVAALKRNDFVDFKRLIIESGTSSWMLCQNVFACSAPSQQGLSVALTVSERMLKDKGAWRLHGGGFAGTIQAFVPHAATQEYTAAMQTLFGEGAVHRLFVRPKGMFVYR